MRAFPGSLDVDTSRLDGRALPRGHSRLAMRLGCLLQSQVEPDWSKLPQVTFGHGADMDNPRARISKPHTSSLLRMPGFRLTANPIAR